MTRRPPRSTLFPYTPLSRSRRSPSAPAVDDRPPPTPERLLGRGDAAARCLLREQEGVRKLESHRPGEDRKSTRLNSSHGYISYAVFCLKKKKKERRRDAERS